MCLLAEKAKEIASEDEDSDYPVLLVCGDSLTAHVRSEYVGHGELASRQQKLNKHLHDIDRVSNLYNAAVVVTNQVQSNSSAMANPGNRRKSSTCSTERLTS